MTRSAYPLAAVEDLRRRRRDEAQESLGRLREEARVAGGAVAEAVSAVEAARGDLETARRDLYAPSTRSGVLDVGAVDRRRRGLGVLDRRIEEHLAELERRRGASAAADEALRQGRAHLAEAAQQLTAIEKHRERWQRRLDAEARRREDKALDEIAASRFVAGRRARGAGG